MRELVLSQKERLPHNKQYICPVLSCSCKHEDPCKLTLSSSITFPRLLKFSLLAVSSFGNDFNSNCLHLETWIIIS